jgi:type VI secretion system protein ImpL
VSVDLLQRLRRPGSWLVIGGGAFSIGTIVVFQMLGWSLLIALIVVLVLALVVVILLLLRQLRSARASEEIETTIIRQADRDIERSVAGQAAEAETMKAELLAAIEALKRSKLGLRGGKAALARLPWYMMVGPPEAGKSSLVAGSGLHFPLADESRRPRAVRGVGGTRSLQWWLSEEAVLLDMPGRQLTTADFEDNEDWFAFLATLRRQRRHKPLNGVIVTVGLDQIAERNETEVEALANRVRDRVQELIQHLGVVFPTYVMFTRADRLAGFAEFFDGLDPTQRAEPWGAAIAMGRAREADAEGRFDRELDLLMAALSERRLERVAALPDPGQRARAFAFPAQLERLRPGMRRFLGTLFESDPRTEGALFRGFYFASAARGGVPVDGVLQPAARALDLPGDGAAPPATQDARSGAEDGWFTRDLLARVVFPDAALAVPTRREELSRRRRQAVLFAGLGVAFLAGTILLSGLSCANRRIVSRTERAALDVDRQVSPERPLVTNLGYLEALRVQAALVDSLARGTPWYRRLGGYAGDRVREPAIRLHVDRTLRTVVGPGVRAIEERLRRWTDEGSGTLLPYYHYYRSWRLLTDAQHLEAEDAPLVAEVVSDALRERIAGASPAERDAFPTLVARQVGFLAAHRNEMSSRSSLYYRSADQELVVRGAERLRAMWDARPFYDRLMAQIRGRTRALDFARLAGPTDLLTGSYQVPGPFTREGWKDHVKPRTDWYARHVESDWVIAGIFGDNRPRLADDILGHYARDYVQHWLAFLRGVDAGKASSPATADAMLKKLAEDDSPLFRVLKGVAEHTRLEVDAGTPMGRVGQEFALAHGFEEARGKGPQWWQSVLQRLPGRGKGDAEVDPEGSPKANYLKLLRNLHEKVAATAQPGAPSATFQALIIEAPDQPNPIRQLREFCDGLAGQFGGAAAGAAACVLKLPIKIVNGQALQCGDGSAVTQQAQWPPAVRDPWKNQLAASFQQTLGGKYPLAADGQDATLDDFAAFFKPGGVFWSFYDQWLKTYVNEDGTPVSAEAAAYVPGELSRTVAQARAIREAFFAGGAQEPKLEFDVRTTQPVPDNPATLIRWTALDLHGQTYDYSMGQPVWQALTWPGTDPAAGAGIRVNTSAGVAQLPPRPGAWGLFHLLDAGRYRPSGEGNAEYTFRLAGAAPLSISYEFRGTSSQRAFQPGFLRFRLPEP